MDYRGTSFAVPYDVLDLPVDPGLTRSYYSTHPLGLTKMKPRQQEFRPETGDIHKPVTGRLGDKNLLKSLSAMMGGKGQPQQQQPTGEPTQQVGSSDTKVAMPSNLSWRI
jgi:hypothetical protein